MGITEQSLTDFATQSYTLVTQLVPEVDRENLFQHAMQRSKTATMRPDTRVPETPAAYADPQMEELLQRLLPAIEQITQLRLFPTYSYFRVYKAGDVLERHTDRPACEISVSVSLGYEAPAPWPIWIEANQGTKSLEMRAGDAVVYRGIDCPHWREAFNGKFAAQVFLHYVDQHGPRAEWKFDKRQRLGLMPNEPVRFAEQVRSIQMDGVLEFGVGKKLELDPFLTLIMKDMEAGHLVAVIVQHAVNEFGVSESEAQVTILNFISLLEQRGLLSLNCT
jgi:hypothetical protein